MIRFSTRSLLFLTTIVAAYVTMGAEAKSGPTPAGVVAIVLYLTLMFWAIFRTGKERNCDDALPNQAGEEEQHPPTH